MKKPGTDLKIRDWKHDFQSFDYTNVFDIYVPSELNLGKNQIKIDLVGSRLEKDSIISIDLIDSLGQPIYHEISNLVNPDKTRSIVCHITEETPNGIAVLYISAQLAKPFEGNKYLYKTEILVNNGKSVEIDFAFKEIPTVKYEEKVFYSTQTNGQTSRKVEVPSNANSTVSVYSRIVPKQLETSNLTVEKETPKTVITETPNVQNDKVRSNTVQLPTYLENSVLTSENYIFSSSMEGGTIYLNNVNFPATGFLAEFEGLQNLSYSASIVKVINTSSIEIYPPIFLNTTYNFRGQTGNYNADKLLNHSNFTCSFYDYLPTTSIPVTKSFAVFEIGNLETEYGKLEAVKLSYKPVNEVGDFREAGTFKTQNSPNLLVANSGSQLVEFSKEGLKEKSVGRFSNSADFSVYWVTESGFISQSLSEKVTNGVKVFGQDLGYYAGFKLKNGFTSSLLFTNTELELSFDWVLESTQNAQMDIYVLGPTATTTQENSKYKPVFYEPSSSAQIGPNVTYLGSITKENKESNSKLRFKTQTESGANFIFKFNYGNWHLGNIELKPVQEQGQSPSQMRIVTPLDNVITTGSELIMRLDYIGANNSVNYSSDLYGVKFDGVQTPQAISNPSTSAFIGEIRMIASSTTPTNWLICSGSAVSRTTYSYLFSVIGTAFGEGDGSTTFNLPDLRDRFPVGAGSTYSIGSTGGASTVTLLDSNLPAHTHTVSIPVTSDTGFSSDPEKKILGGANIYKNPETYDSDLSAFNTGTTGSSEPFSIVPKYLGIKYIICYNG
jgi:microcystin-dependent protein